MKFKIWRFMHFTVPQTLNAFIFLYNRRSNIPVYLGEVLVSLKLLLVLIINNVSSTSFPLRNAFFCGDTVLGLFLIRLVLMRVFSEEERGLRLPFLKGLEGQSEGLADLRFSPFFCEQAQVWIRR